MKTNDIITLNDLKVFLTAYQEENPEDDCCELVRSICEENGWIYTSDSEGIDYDDEDWATDGEHILSFTSEGWELFDNNGQDIEHNGREITVREDGENWYVNLTLAWVKACTPRHIGRWRRLSTTRRISITRISNHYLCIR